MGALRQWENRHVECPFCKAHRANRSGSRKNKKQAYFCRECGHCFTEGVTYVIP